MDYQVGSTEVKKTVKSGPFGIFKKETTEYAPVILPVKIFSKVELDDENLDESYLGSYDMIRLAKYISTMTDNRFAVSGVIVRPFNEDMSKSDFVAFDDMASIDEFENLIDRGGNGKHSNDQIISLIIVDSVENQKITVGAPGSLVIAFEETASTSLIESFSKIMAGFITLFDDEFMEQLDDLYMAALVKFRVASDH